MSKQNNIYHGNLRQDYRFKHCILIQSPCMIIVNMSQFKTRLTEINIRKQKQKQEVSKVSELAACDN